MILIIYLELKSIDKSFRGYELNNLSFLKNFSKLTCLGFNRLNCAFDKFDFAPLKYCKHLSCLDLSHSIFDLSAQKLIYLNMYPSIKKILAEGASMRGNINADLKEAGSQVIIDTSRENKFEEKN